MGIWLRKSIKGKCGSSAVMLAIIFLGFAVCLAGAVNVSRKLTAYSECEAFGRVWSRAILSEYDVHLFEDYSIMAYYGSDDDVSRKLDAYLKYSAQGRLDTSIKGANADLTGYELGDPHNFKRAMSLGFAAEAVSEFINGRGRTYRGSLGSEGEDEADGDDIDYGDDEEIVISNPVVLDTLPSHGASDTVSGDTLTEKAKNASDENKVLEMMKSAGSEILLIQKCFDNHVTKADDKEHLFVNEWEYIIKGSNDDRANYRACRNRLFIARNALNLISLYMDPEKTELITAAAETITPGPLGLVTQVIISEAWAALETEEDLKTLYSDGRVPVIKSDKQWRTDLGAVLGSSEVRGKLDEESIERLDQNRDELSEAGEKVKTVTQIKVGLNYDEYLMLMIMSLNDNTRLLRIMDLVQINMKYRYYRDFDLMEYYTGARFSIEVNGRSHEFEDSYK